MDNLENTTEKLLDYDFVAKVSFPSYFSIVLKIGLFQICYASNRHSNFEEPLVQIHFKVDTPGHSNIDFEVSKDELDQLVSKMERVNKDL